MMMLIFEFNSSAHMFARLSKKSVYKCVIERERKLLFILYIHVYNITIRVNLDFIFYYLGSIFIILPVFILKEFLEFFQERQSIPKLEKNKHYPRRVTRTRKLKSILKIMLDINVKTIDGQSRSYSVPDNVKNLSKIFII